MHTYNIRLPASAAAAAVALAVLFSLRIGIGECFSVHRPPPSLPSCSLLSARRPGQILTSTTTTTATTTTTTRSSRSTCTLKSTTDDNMMMMVVNENNDEDVVAVIKTCNDSFDLSEIIDVNTMVDYFNTGVSTSLASSYVIHVVDDESKSSLKTKDEKEGQGPLLTWVLTPLQETDRKGGGETGEENGVGSLAIEGLKSSFDPSSSSSSSSSYRTKLICNSFVGNNGGTISIEVNVETQIENAEEEESQTLIAVLSRVMVQQNVRNILRNLISSSENASKMTEISMSLPSSTGSITSETISISDLLASSGCPSLYQSLLPPNTDMTSIEMSDMVDSSGKVLGSVPRILVHKLNILHRGIGIVVCHDEHITKVKRNNENKDDHDPIVDIYCHRRTDTKRIFPSLYDMFVGGVSVSGESSELTAAREVGEELGLDRALHCIESSSKKANYMAEDSPLSSPLFRCTVCTSYNRCVVTVFTYQYKSDQDEIKWQEEEVSWGDFVPYRIVEQAATMSIDRLIQSNKWPGLGNDIDMKILDELASFSNSGHECEDWDFVPDGLLVWMAWLNWFEKD